MSFQQRVFTVFALFAVSLSPAYAQKWALDTIQVKSYDFGSVSHGAKAEYEFEIYNPYVEDIQISAISASCSCTTVTMEKRTLKTYETGKILAHFNTDRFYGPKSAVLTVHFTKPFPTSIQLNVKGYIRSDVVFNPGSVEFGSVYPGETQEKEVSLSYSGRSDWKITEAKSSDPNVEVEVTEAQRQNGNVRYNLKVKLSPETPVGYIKDRITLVTNDRTSQGIQLMVEGQVKSSIMVSPSSLMMGSIESGKETIKQLVIRGDKPFKIKNITCPNPGFTFTLPSEEESVAKTVHVVPVKFKADEINIHANITETIKIETDAKQTTAELPAYVEVKPGSSSQMEIIAPEATKGT